jgi:hypothetical protein
MEYYYILLIIGGLLLVFLIFYRTKIIVKAAVMSLGLAAWKIFGESAYKSWLEGQGLSAGGMGETAFGYFVAILISWGAASLVTRSMDGEEDEG